MTIQTPFLTAARTTNAAGDTVSRFLVRGPGTVANAITRALRLAGLPTTADYETAGPVTKGRVLDAATRTKCVARLRMVRIGGGIWEVTLS